MVKKLLVLFFLLFNCYFTHAETIKTDVLVIGNGASAVTAAMQSARSKLKTILIVKGGWLEDIQPEKGEWVTIDSKLSPGIWGEFRKQVHDFYKKTPGYDTACNAPLKFEPATGAGILKKMADTVKNLTIKLNTPFISIKKDGTGWELSVAINGKISFIKAKVVIDATANGEVVTKAGAKIPAGFNTERDEKGQLYRTSIAVCDLSQTGAFTIPMRNLVVRDLDNLLITDEAWALKNNFIALPSAMILGQGAGTIAAYCAFFKTTTKNLRPRIIQGELLDFKGYLLPFNDIDQTDIYWRSIQQIAVTGLLKGAKKDDLLLFEPGQPVLTAEIKPVLTEIYSRAFLWFNKIKPGEEFTVGNLLSFISEITLTEPKLFQITLQKEWKAKYKFTADFNIDHPVTRREFAVLANKFLNPFARAVDLDGNMIN